MYEGFIQNASILPHTSYHIGGKAKFLARVNNVGQLLRALELSENRLILGKGSKVLVSDKGFDGVVILMRLLGVQFYTNKNSADIVHSPKATGNILTENKAEEKSKEITSLRDVGNSGGVVYAEAGVSLPALSRLYANKGLIGMEWACGIPASIGGALKLNAGAYGGDMAQLVNYADVLRGGKKIRLSKEQCGFKYRGSGFYPQDVILGAEMKAEKGDEAEISRLRALYGEKRAAAQPAGFSCGSVFKAKDKPAYTYIQDCGFKGQFIGDAAVSEKHANFILNRGFAKARDVYNLIRAIKAEVFVKFGVKLKEEVVFAGEF